MQSTYTHLPNTHTYSLSLCVLNGCNVQVHFWCNFVTDESAGILQCTVWFVTCEVASVVHIAGLSIMLVYTLRVLNARWGTLKTLRNYIYFLTYRHCSPQGLSVWLTWAAVCRAPWSRRTADHTGPWTGTLSTLCPGDHLWNTQTHTKVSAGIAPQWLRALNSWSKGHRFKSQQEHFLLQGQLSVLTLISVSIPPPYYLSSMWKIAVSLPKVHMAGYS